MVDGSSEEMNLRFGHFGSLDCWDGDAGSGQAQEWSSAVLGNVVHDLRLLGPEVDSREGSHGGEGALGDS